MAVNASFVMYFKVSVRIVFLISTSFYRSCSVDCYDVNPNDRTL